MPKRSNRLEQMPPYIFSVIGDQLRKMQAEGIEVIRLDIGNPDMPPPSPVIEALAQTARRPDAHGYMGYRGIPAFRQAIAEHYQKRFGVTLNPDTQVLPLIGSKEGIINLSLAYLDHGDVALIPEVGYPSYAMGAMLAGATPCYVPMPEQMNYRLDLEAVPEGMRRAAKLLWVNYPNNPTGAVVAPGFYEQALQFCRQYDILLVSDNPYVDVTFGDYTAGSALQIAGAPYDNLIEFFSFSKSYNMAGWRLGAAVGSEQAITNLLGIKSNMDGGHFRAVYEAGIVALQTSQDWIQRRNAVYKQRQDMVLNSLPRIGLCAGTSSGSLYVWAKVENQAMQGYDYVKQALAHAQVSLAPGGAYGPGGTQYVRISLSSPDDRLEQALSMLESWYTRSR